MTLFIPRAAWTATAPSSNGRWRDVLGVAVHYPADGNVTNADLTQSQVAAKLRGYRNYHVNTRGWGDIGYNFAVDQAGRVWELRGMDNVGAHCASRSNPDANTRYVGVLFVVGNAEQPTAAAVEAFKDLRTRILARFPAAVQVVGHGQVPGAQTACPGQHLLALAGDGTLTGQTPVPVATPPAAPSPTATVSVDGKWGAATTRALQALLGTQVDGVVSHQWRSSHNENLYAAQFDRTAKGSNVIRALQRTLRATGHYLGNIDGLCGPMTIRALQRHLGTTVDGVISPVSQMVTALQRRINAGRL